MTQPLTPWPGPRTYPGQTRVNSNLNNKSARLWDSGKRNGKKFSATLNLLLCPKDGIQNETTKNAKKIKRRRNGKEQEITGAGGRGQGKGLTHCSGWWMMGWRRVTQMDYMGESGLEVPKARPKSPSRPVLAINLKLTNSVRRRRDRRNLFRF